VVRLSGFLLSEQVVRHPNACDKAHSGLLSRREFLGGTAAAGLSILTQDTRSRAQTDGPTTWALLADTHISSDLGESVRGANMAENLKRVVRQVLACSPDRILFNGDMAFKMGLPADYEALLKIIEPLQERKTPVHFTLGNHDHRENFLAAVGRSGRSALDGKSVSAFIDSGMRWVFLDSLHRVNGFSGRLGVQQLGWLEQLLDERKDIATIVCLHHNPENTITGLKDTDPFLDMLKPRKQVKAVMFGHTHVYRRWSVAGLHLINLPAVGYPFNPFEPLGWIQGRIQPGSLELKLRTLKENHAQNHRLDVLKWRRDT
jgi:3',5'-cyclic AMP phosphodiesterase CpdA